MANVTLTIDDQRLAKARRTSTAIGKSLNQLIRGYLESLPEPQSTHALNDQFIRLSQEAKGNSAMWEFNRDEIHER